MPIPQKAVHQNKGGRWKMEAKNLPLPASYFILILNSVLRAYSFGNVRRTPTLREHPSPLTPLPSLLSPHSSPLTPFMLDIDPFSLVEPAYLVTIVGESILKDSLIKLLKDLKVRSYTVSDIQGEGRYMRRSADPEASTRFVETSLEIRAIVSQELSQVILHVLKEQQTDFAIFAYRQPVEALIDDM